VSDRPHPPATTLRLILEGLPPSANPLDQAVWRIEQNLDRLEWLLRQQAAENRQK
jgi:hypothetical protein